MASKSPNVFLNVMALFKNLSSGRLIALSCLVGATIAGLVWVVIWSATPEFHLLYSNLSLEDAGEIVMKLKEQKVQYQISSDGRAVLIPKDKIYETRLILANEGLPQGSGVGFEIFDSTSLGMTEFVQNVNYQRALQGELSRTINGFNEIESSRVHIVMPSESLFIEDEESPSASVALKLRKGRRLSENQIRGIVHLISASISHLEPEDVTIVDNEGRMLAGSEEKSSIAQLSSSQLEYQEKVEQNLEKRIGSMLEKILGPGKAIARITCALDFRRHEKTEELYDPDGRVVRSEQVMNTVSNKSEPMAMGIPGVDSNMPGEEPNTTVPDEQKSNIPEYQKQDKTVNYEIGKVTSHTIASVGKIERISVAVVVDGIHDFNTGEDGESGWEYTPRSQEELTKIEDIVKRAVNFDAERGDEIEVRNIPFEINKAIEDREETVEQGWLTTLQKYSEYLRYAFLVVFLLLSFLFVVRPLVRWLTATPAGGGEMLKQLPMTVEEIERGYGEGTYSLPFRDKAKNMLLGEDEASLTIAKEWLSEQ
jgi:flagellar M-ring protein FliF